MKILKIIKTVNRYIVYTTGVIMQFTVFALPVIVPVALVIGTFYLVAWIL